MLAKPTDEVGTLDKRDALTKQLFDENTVKVVDNTDGVFSDWFEGDMARIARLSGAPTRSTVQIEWIEGGVQAGSDR